MRLSDGRHFSYCLNVHPGEGVDDLLHALRAHVPRVKDALSPNAPFGLGLRIARDAAIELRDPDTLARLRDAIDTARCYAFTVNGFPYGAFHGTRVKENVYLPDWSSPERLDYTLDLIDHLHALLPEGEEGSISTVPLGYKFRPDASPRHLEACTAHLAAVAAKLARLEADTGRLLHLGLEPEPDCVLETTDETIEYFYEHLFRGPEVDEQLVRRHIGVCVDTCHAAVQFEDPAAVLRKYMEASILVSKVQISAALECVADVPIERLAPFDDGVYLHQVKTASGDARRDLPAWTHAPDPNAGTLRIHAHVPLHWPGDGPLRSTRHTLTPGFWNALADSECPHLEVETYTFDVLPDDLRQDRDVADDMILECRWALDRM